MIVVSVCIPIVNEYVCVCGKYLNGIIFNVLFVFWFFFVYFFFHYLDITLLMQFYIMKYKTKNLKFSFK